MDQKPKRATVDDLNAPDQLIPWADIVDTVFHHRKMIVAICTAGVTFSLLWAWITPPVYKATAMIMVTGNRAQLTVTPDPRSRPMFEADGVQQINSLAALVRSPALIEEVIVASSNNSAGSGSDDRSFVVWLQDSINEMYWKIRLIPDTLYRWAHGLPPPTAMESKVARVLNKLIFIPVPESNLVEVSFVSRSPGWARRIVNALVDRLIAKYTSLHESTGALRFYEDQRVLLASRLAEAQSNLTKFRERVGSELLSVELGDLQERVATLETDLLTTQTRLAELESLAEAPVEVIVADSSTADAESGALANPVVTTLKERLVELEIERSELLSRYTKGSVAVRDLDRQIADAKRLLAEERENSVAMYRRNARAKMEVAQAKIEALRKQLVDYRHTQSKLEEVIPEFSRLQNDVRTQQEAYLTYLRKEEEARLSSALDESQLVNIAVAERAETPTEPMGGRMKKRILFGGVLSVLLAAGIAMFRDWMDPSVKTGSQAERLIGLPVLGEIQG